MDRRCLRDPARLAPSRDLASQLPREKGPANPAPACAPQSCRSHPVRRWRCVWKALTLSSRIAHTGLPTLARRRPALPSGCRANGLQKVADIALQRNGLLPKRRRSRKSSFGTCVGLAGHRPHVADLLGDRGGSACRLLDISRDVACRGALLLDCGGNRRGNLGHFLDGYTEL